MNDIRPASISANKTTKLPQRVTQLVDTLYDSPNDQVPKTEFLDKWYTNYCDDDKIRVEQLADNDFILVFEEGDWYANPTFGLRIRLNGEGKIEVYKTSKIYTSDNGARSEYDLTLADLNGNVDALVANGSLIRVSDPRQMAQVLTLFDKSENGMVNNVRAEITEMLQAHRKTLSDAISVAEPKDKKERVQEFVNFIRVFNPKLRAADMKFFTYNTGEYDSTTKRYLDAVVGADLYYEVKTEGTTAQNFEERVRQLEEIFAVFDNDAYASSMKYSADLNQAWKERNSVLYSLISSFDDATKTKLKDLIYAGETGAKGFCEANSDGGEKITEEELAQLMDVIRAGIIDSAAEADKSAILSAAATTGATAFTTALPTELTKDNVEITGDKKTNLLQSMGINVEAEDFDINQYKVYQYRDGDKTTTVVKQHDVDNDQWVVDAVEYDHSNADNVKVRKLENYTKSNNIEMAEIKTQLGSRAQVSVDKAIDEAKAVYKEGVETLEKTIHQMSLSQTTYDEQVASLPRLNDNLNESLKGYISRILVERINQKQQGADIDPEADLRDRIDEALRTKLALYGHDANVIDTKLADEAVKSAIDSIVGSLAETDISKVAETLDTNFDSIIAALGLNIPPETQELGGSETMKIFAAFADGMSGSGSDYINDLITDIGLQIARGESPNHRKLTKIREYLSSIGKLPESFDSDIADLVTAANEFRTGNNAGLMYLDALEFDRLGLKAEMAKLNTLLAEDKYKNQLDLNLTEFYQLYQSDSIPASIIDKNKDLVEDLTKAGITDIDAQRRALMQLFKMRQAESVDPGIARDLKSYAAFDFDLVRPQDFDMKAFREKLMDPNNRAFANAYEQYLEEISFSGDDDMAARFRVFDALLRSADGDALDFINSNDERLPDSLLAFADRDLRFYESYKAFKEADHSVSYDLNPRALESLVQNLGFEVDRQTREVNINGDFSQLMQLAYRFGMIYDPNRTAADLYNTNERGQVVPVDNSPEAKANAQAATDFINRFNNYGEEYNPNMTEQEFIDRLYVAGYINNDGSLNATAFKNVLGSRISTFLRETYPQSLSNPQSFLGRAADEQSVFEYLNLVFGNENLRRGESQLTTMISKDEFAKSLSSFARFCELFENDYQAETKRAKIPAPAPVKAEEPVVPPAPALPAPVGPGSRLWIQADPFSSTNVLDIMLANQKEKVQLGEASWNLSA